MTLLMPPEPGDRFSVLDRAEPLTVTQLIAKLEAPEQNIAMYIVAADDGQRWVLLENELDDGYRWIGVPPRGDAP